MANKKQRKLSERSAKGIARDLKKGRGDKKTKSKLWRILKHKFETYPKNYQLPYLTQRNPLPKSGERGRYKKITEFESAEARLFFIGQNFYDVAGYYLFSDNEQDYYKICVEWDDAIVQERAYEIIAKEFIKTAKLVCKLHRERSGTSQANCNEDPSEKQGEYTFPTAIGNSCLPCSLPPNLVIGGTCGYEERIRLRPFIDIIEKNLKYVPDIISLEKRLRSLDDKGTWKAENIRIRIESLIEKKLGGGELLYPMPLYHFDF